MRFNFDSSKFGKCFIATEQKGSYVSIDISHGPNDRATTVQYRISVTGEPPAIPAPRSSTQEDAARIAVGHFEASSGSNHAIFEFRCGPMTQRWTGEFS